MSAILQASMQMGLSPAASAQLRPDMTPQAAVQSLLDAGILDRRDERVDVGLRRDGGGERPPELDGVVARGLRRGGAVEEGELREEDRAVERVRHRRVAFWRFLRSFTIRKRSFAW